MTFAEISKSGQHSSKLSSESIPFAFPNRVEQLERKEGTLKKNHRHFWQTLGTLSPTL